jgi:hypothetical protein
MATKKKAPAKKVSTKKAATEETSARTRGKVAARKKSGENYLIKPTYGRTDSYFRKAYSDNDLAGIRGKQFDSYVYSNSDGRTTQRAKDQAKRKKK